MANMVSVAGMTETATTGRSAPPRENTSWHERPPAVSGEIQLPPIHWSRMVAAALIALVGWVPLAPGDMLRGILYRLVFARIGSNVRIQSGVSFFGTHGIDIGNAVGIERGSAIRSFGQRSSISLGDASYLDHGVDIKANQDGHISLGTGSYVGPYSCLSALGNLAIGKNCLIASHTSIYAHNHTFSDPRRNIKDQGFTYRGIVIEDDCWLGSGVRVLDGVRIGQGSVIGAGAVVTKNIPPYSVAVGVPAKVVSRRSDPEDGELLERDLALVSDVTEAVAGLARPGTPNRGR